MTGRHTTAIDLWCRLIVLASTSASFACSESAESDPVRSGSVDSGNTSATDHDTAGTSCGPDCSNPVDSESTPSAGSTAAPTSASSTGTGAGGTAGQSSLASAGGAGGGAEPPPSGGASSTSTSTTYVVCKNGGVDVEFCLTQEQMETQARFGYWPELPLDPPRSDEEIAEAWDEQGCLPALWVGSTCCNGSVTPAQRRGNQCCYTSCEGEVCCGMPPIGSVSTGTAG
ncbi:MAG TPA: hypothetical protein VFU02_09500 [Polyangiaceae bacterium]|nr:hypothetical protein [Polyangiaceae bacterium]